MNAFPRGNNGRCSLSSREEFEYTSITLFERVSPSPIVAAV